MNVRKGFFLLLFLIHFFPLYSQNSIPSESIYVIDSVLEEYGSLLENLEIVMDMKGIN